MEPVRNDYIQDLGASTERDGKACVEGNGDLNPLDDNSSGVLKSKIPPTQSDAASLMEASKKEQDDSDSEEPLAKFKRPRRSRKIIPKDTLDDDMGKVDGFSAVNSNETSRSDLIYGLDNYSGMRVEGRTDADAHVPDRIQDRIDVEETIQFSAVEKGAGNMIEESDEEEMALTKFKRPNKSKKTVVNAAMNDAMKDTKEYDKEKGDSSPHLNDVQEKIDRIMEESLIDNENQANRQTKLSEAIEDGVQVDAEEEESLTKIKRPRRLKRKSTTKPLVDDEVDEMDVGIGSTKSENDIADETAKELSVDIQAVQDTEDISKIQPKNDSDEVQNDSSMKRSFPKLKRVRKTTVDAVQDMTKGINSAPSIKKGNVIKDDNFIEIPNAKVKNSRKSKGKEAMEAVQDKIQDLKDNASDDQQDPSQNLKTQKPKKSAKDQTELDSLSRQTSATETDLVETKVDAISRRQKTAKRGRFTPDSNSNASPSVSADKRLSDSQRTIRRAKKRRHGDMAYEGDSDWDVLMNGEPTMENRSNSDKERLNRNKSKGGISAGLLAQVVPEEEAAVAAGLKFRKVGPIEKIKFKEVLKRRGGLQEYLECRNSILSLWSRNVRRILPLSDCGVSIEPQPDESPQAALTRDIYKFLDSHGYINIGVAVQKPKIDDASEPKLKISTDGPHTENYGDKMVDAEEEVAFILGQIKGSEENNSSRQDTLVGAEDVKGIVDVKNSTEVAVFNRGDYKDSGMAVTDADEPSLFAMKQVEDCNAESATGFDTGREKDPIMKGPVSDATKADGEDEFSDIDSAKVLHGLGRKTFQKDMHLDAQDVEKFQAIGVGVSSVSQQQRRVIVVGAGPSGLAAARHLQRQNIGVTVLEARDRVGGRVHTDHTSLSVPVDLGASIITGVQADVATERRPDPSALICTQLGLELTVLNSDCPLYDSVSGTRVPANVDEALEQEFNVLLDDMVIQVSQNADAAMSMSLEEGFEFALKKRRAIPIQSNTPELSSTKASEDPDCLRSKESLLDGSLNIENTDVGYDPKTSTGDKKSVVAVKDNEVNEYGLSDVRENCEILTPLERRVMDWHFANLEYGCAAELKLVSLPNWNQDDAYGGFGGAHCMIKKGYSTVMEALAEGLDIRLDQVVTDIKYYTEESGSKENCKRMVKVYTNKGQEFVGDAVLITIPLGCLKSNAIKFTPDLPDWKLSAIKRLGFGVLNKVVMEFPNVFWDESLDYFGATAESTDSRGRCFMFWNLKKTVGAPVLIALVVGKAAVDGQNTGNPDHVKHALMVLRKLFGEEAVPDPVASVTTNWGADPFSKGAYSYVAIGASGEDYDILGRPVESCLFFAGEATCKEHPDTVGGAIISGLREAVRIVDMLENREDSFALAEAMVAAQSQSDIERTEVREMMKRLEAGELSGWGLVDGEEKPLSKDALLQDMFRNARTTAGRLYLAKKMLQLPASSVKAFAGTKEGLSVLNEWILDSMGKDGTQLLRHCVRLLLIVSTDMLSVRQSGIGKTVKEKVCVHTSRDIRAIASQLVSMWIEVFRREKANGGWKLLKQPVSTAINTKGNMNMSVPQANKNLPLNPVKLEAAKEQKKDTQGNKNLALQHPVKVECLKEHKKEANVGRTEHVAEGQPKTYEYSVLAELEAKAIAAEAAARAAAAHASSEAESSTFRELPKIPSFHNFVRREHMTQKEDSEAKKRKWSGAVLGKQDCSSEIDSRSCRVKNWSVDFTATCGNLESSRLAVSDLGGSDFNKKQRSQSNEVNSPSDLKEQSAETGMADSKVTKLEGQNSGIKIPEGEYDKRLPVNKYENKDEARGSEHIKKGIADYVASLLMPLYKTRRIDKDGYKSIMKKSTIKVLEHNTAVENAMSVSEFLDCKRRNKIRALVDKFIERHLARNQL